jgi:hypothetical protein
VHTVEESAAPQRLHLLTGNLFEVIPPDDPEDPAPATEQDWQWYRDLREATAHILLYIVENVRRNYLQHRRVAFGNATVRGLRDRCSALARDYLDHEMSTSQVSGAINRVAKQFGLVVYSKEPGRRHNWLRHGRDNFDLDEALEIVEEALRGRWPHRQEVAL